MNCYISVCLLALVATSKTMPKIDDDISNNNNNSDYDESKSFLLNSDLQNKPYRNSRVVRYLHRIIDGTVHRIQAAGVIYRQRLREDQCVVEYDGKYLSENSVIQIRKKLYRVENCLLERVFHACGPNLLLMLNVVCRVVEQHQTTTTPTLQRPIAPPTFIYRLHGRASKTPRVITESCCENLCTISELTRYCHR
jgi:hypothetical protein